MKSKKESKVEKQVAKEIASTKGLQKPAQPQLPGQKLVLKKRKPTYSIGGQKYTFIPEGNQGMFK